VLAIKNYLDARYYDHRSGVEELRTFQACILQNFWNEFPQKPVRSEHFGTFTSIFRCVNKEDTFVDIFVLKVSVLAKLPTRTNTDKNWKKICKIKIHDGKQKT